MSITLMSKAYSITVGDSGAKFVLVKLADNANDDGFCYPSNHYLMKHCEMGERTIQRHIKKLEKLGFIKITERKGKSNFYQIILDGTPAESAPRQIGTPARLAGYPRQIDTTPPPDWRDTPAKLAPITIKNHKEPSINHKKGNFDPLTVKPENVNFDVWAHWIDYRKKLGKKLQPESWIKQSQMLETQNNPEEIINDSIRNGWQGLFPKKNTVTKNNPHDTSWINNLESEFF